MPKQDLIYNAQDLINHLTTGIKKVKENHANATSLDVINFSLHPKMVKTQDKSEKEKLKLLNEAFYQTPQGSYSIFIPAVCMGLTRHNTVLGDLYDYLEEKTPGFNRYTTPHRVTFYF
jgi:hypothetical protein